MVGRILLAYAFYYPLSMAWVWIFGALSYYLRRERNAPSRILPPQLPSWPKATLVVPCHNEGDNVRDTVGYLAAQDYPDFEIIAINDGSRDNTGSILDELTTVYPQLRVLHFPKNQGKAMGLCMAALASNSEYLICIDGDALLDPFATRWLMWHLLSGPRVGAVTGQSAYSQPLQSAWPSAGGRIRHPSSASSSARSAPLAASLPCLGSSPASAAPPCIRSVIGARTW